MIRYLIPGFIIIFFLIAVVASSITALISYSGGFNIEKLLDEYIQQVIFFSFHQALLSSILSILIAVIIGRCFIHSPFPKLKNFLLKFYSLPMVIPIIVTIFGLMAILGKSGWLNQIYYNDESQYMNFPFGLTGILIAHIFLNFPFATRLIVQALETIPYKSWRLSQQLNMGTISQFRCLEWPVLKQTLPSLFALIFLLCFTSFTVVLTLGGGPHATTIELAIYEFIRLDFDLGNAAMLAIVQFIICFGLHLTFPSTSKVDTVYEAQDIDGGNKYRTSSPIRIAAIISFVLASLVTIIIMLPFITTVIQGFNGSLKHLLYSDLFSAFKNSFYIGAFSSTLSVFFALGILITTRYLTLTQNYSKTAQWIDTFGSMILIVPAFVIATGLFLRLHQHVDIFEYGLILVIIINAFMWLPFALKILKNPFFKTEKNYSKLCQSLSINGLPRWYYIEWPLLKAPLGLAFATCFAFGFGDLGIIALFGTQDTQTLSLRLYQELGSYHFDDAKKTAFIFLVSCLFIFYTFEFLFKIKLPSNHFFKKTKVHHA